MNHLEFPKHLSQKDWGKSRGRRREVEREKKIMSWILLASKLFSAFEVRHFRMGLGQGKQGSREYPGTAAKLELRR